MIRILTPRFRLRPLVPNDASERYCSWFDEATAKRFIVSATETHDIPSLRKYIIEKSGRNDVLFLGMFTRKHGEHIGNIKYEPIAARERYAVMGILIGEPAWRGQGVAEEVITASAEWLKKNLGIAEIVLGVSKDNLSGLKAYEKAGFKPYKSQRITVDLATTITMVRELRPINAR